MTEFVSKSLDKRKKLEKELANEISSEISETGVGVGVVRKNGLIDLAILTENLSTVEMNHIDSM